MQLLRGKSIILYLPPKGTAGLAIFLVKTPSRVPCPPARINATTILFAPLLDFLNYTTCGKITKSIMNKGDI
jgi:hypothetical protein